MNFSSIIMEIQRKKGDKNRFVETVVNGRYWANNLDVNIHKNNERYLRQCDFGRFSLLLETDL